MDRHKTINEHGQHAHNTCVTFHRCLQSSNVTKLIQVQNVLMQRGGAWWVRQTRQGRNENCGLMVSSGFKVTTQTDGLHWNGVLPGAICGG